jgi:hypothetical protein
MATLSKYDSLLLQWDQIIQVNDKVENAIL